MTFARFVLALVSALLPALASFPALALSRWKRVVVLIVVAVPIVLAPVWISKEAPLIRLLAAMFSTALLVKLYDLHVVTPASSKPDFRRFAAFLPNGFSVVWRRLGAEPKPPIPQDLALLGRSVWKLVAAVVVLAWLFQRNWNGVPFVAEHCAKALGIFCTIIPGSMAATALWRLAGGRARDFMEAPLLAATPADFWRRYNRPAQQFFHEDVFKPIGGLRSPVAATLVTFAVSAVVHEYVFGITLGRIQGYQSAFFMLQGVGVVATLRVRPAGWKIWPWLTATWIFNLATSVFFFASLNGVVRFYSRGLPNWLAGW